jgi:hypothetical protein
MDKLLMATVAAGELPPLSLELLYDLAAAHVQKSNGRPFELELA